MEKFASDFGKKFGQDTVFVSEDIVKDNMLVKGEWSKSLLDRGFSIRRTWLKFF